MRLQIFIWAVFVSATLFVTGCSKLIHKSPAEVVTSTYVACNAGKYSEAEAYFSSSGKALINGPLGALAGGMQGLCDQQTQKGALQPVEILKVDVRGEGARVYYRRHYKDGSTKEDHDDLIKENGEWKENH